MMQSDTMPSVNSPPIIYLADRDQACFQSQRTAVDLVCAWDSLTGWNNSGPVEYWPYPCYPQFLREMYPQSDLRIANCGIAGEVSANGVRQVSEYLDLFANAHTFIIGFGTNDLGMWSDLEETSLRVLDHLGQIVRAVAGRGKRSILLNVPYVNESMFPNHLASDTHAQRDYHNPRLKALCEQHALPLADICATLRDEHLADALHPNEAGARIIAQCVVDCYREWYVSIDEGPA
jgi:lysophospholipase L1-like esterase